MEYVPRLFLGNFDWCFNSDPNLIFIMEVLNSVVQFGLTSYCDFFYNWKNKTKSSNLLVVHILYWIYQIGFFNNFNEKINKYFNNKWLIFF